MAEESGPDQTLPAAALLHAWLMRALVLDVLNRKPLTAGHAEVLGRLTGIGARAWLRAEEVYRADLEAGRTDDTPEDGSDAR